MTILMDVCVLLDICDALHGVGDLSAITTDNLQSFADSEFADEVSRAKVIAEIERRSA